MGLRAIPAVVVFVLVASAGLARGDDKPWVQGVSEADQKKALELYRQGNNEFVEDHFTEALAKYQEALKYWDHPAVRFNAAICLDNLERPLEAYEFMQAAMRFGAEPIGKDHFERGHKLLERLDLKTNELEIQSVQKDAEVSLDGKRLALHNGVATQRVLVGEHQIVAVKPHYQTETMPVIVHAGVKVKVVVEMKVEEAAKRVVRRWSRWLPWTVFSVGTAVLAVGGAFDYRFFEDNKLYSSDFKNCVGETMPPNGSCPASQLDEIDRLRNRWLPEAITLMSVGGIAAAAGLYMILENSPHVISADVERNRVAITLTGRW